MKPINIVCLVLMFPQKPAPLPNLTADKGDSDR